MNYDLELDKVAKEIKSSKAKRVVLQFPDGLKTQATKAARELEKKTGATIFVWAGSNFGACDTPTLPKQFDLIVNFGHATFLSRK